MQDRDRAAPFRRLIAVGVAVAYVALPVGYGWLDFGHVECANCVGDVLRHAMAFFGYVVIGGYALSWSQPERPDASSAVATKRPFAGYREDIQANTVFLAFVALALAFAAGFNWRYHFG